MNILFEFDLDRLDMPDFLGVFPDRTVKRKFARSGRIENNIRTQFSVF